MTGETRALNSRSSTISPRFTVYVGFTGTIAVGIGVGVEEPFVLRFMSDAGSSVQPDETMLNASRKATTMIRGVFNSISPVFRGVDLYSLWETD